MTTTTDAPKIRIRSGRVAALSLTAAGLVLLGAAAPAFAAPAGNNGTIKVDGVEFDSHPDNQPHIGCTFQVDFYGYDLGEYFADVTFEAQAPTGDGVLLTDTVFIGEDDNSGAATPEGLDASETYTLVFDDEMFEHPEQGYHVSLTIEADGAQGADVKHKTFWVEGCETPEEEPPVIEEPPVVEVPPVVEEPPAVQPNVTPPAEVLGVTITRAADPAPAAAALPRTGTSSTTLLAAAGTSLLGLGALCRRLGVRLG